MEWDFTLSGESLFRLSWKIDGNDLIGTKTASGAVRLFPVFQGQFSISPNDRATLIIHNATAADGKEITCIVSTDVRDWSDVISVVIKGECSFCCFTKINVYVHVCVCLIQVSLGSFCLSTRECASWFMLTLCNQSAVPFSGYM